jgi:hypothetical protein
VLLILKWYSLILCSGIVNGKNTRQKLRVKASTKVFEIIAKHPGGWDLVKELSQRIAEVHEVIECSA